MRSYTRFEPKENHLSVVSAGDINRLQQTVQRMQEESFQQGDISFLDRALFSLQHHPDTNAMVLDSFEDLSKMDTPKFSNIVYVKETRSLQLAPGAKTGVAFTRMLRSGTSESMERFVLLSDQFVPDGCKIQFSISHDGLAYAPIKANSATPTELLNPKSELFIRVQFDREDVSLEPRLDAWAILYRDEFYAFRFLDDGVNYGIEATWDGTIVD